MNSTPWRSQNASYRGQTGSAARRRSTLARTCGIGLQLLIHADSLRVRILAVASTQFSRDRFSGKVQDSATLDDPLVG
jgi:hypothetical protein